MFSYREIENTAYTSQRRDGFSVIFAPAADLYARLVDYYCICLYNDFASDEMETNN